MDRLHQRISPNQGWGEKLKRGFPGLLLGLAIAAAFSCWPYFYGNPELALPVLSCIAALIFLFLVSVFKGRIRDFWFACGPTAIPWTWSGLGVAFAGLVLFFCANSGFGNPASCGTFGLGCAAAAVIYLWLSQGIASFLLWKGVRSTRRKTLGRYVSLLFFLPSALLFVGGFVVVMWFVSITQK